MSLGLAGCEQANGLSGVDVEPSSVTLASGSNTVEFTVVATSSNAAPKNFDLPIEWRVSDPSLGTIIRSSGFSAVYKRTGKNGDNTVIARDPYDAEGYATVHQILATYTITLTATASPDNYTWTIAASGGQPPYHWSVGDHDMGGLVGSHTGISVVYSGGPNAVQCTDANGVSASIAVAPK